MLANLPSSAAVGVIAAAIILAGGTAFAVTGYESRAHLRLAQATPMPGQGQTTEQGQPGMMGPGMGRGMMRGDRGGSMRPRKMHKHRHMMKIMFAIVDLDGDGALSFEEVSNIHRRIFNAIDANKDDRVTPDEIRDFIQD